MNKAKKNLLSAASILTIVAASFGILVGVAFMFLGSLMTEDVIKESYRADIEYTYYEEADGSYYFTYIEDNQLLTLTETDVEMVAQISSAIVNFMGLINVGFSVAKLVLAIKILVNNNRDKYGKGVVIALLVMSLINSNLIEAGLLLFAILKKDNVENTNTTIDNEDKKEDIIIDNK